MNNAPHHSLHSQFRPSSGHGPGYRGLQRRARRVVAAVEPRPFWQRAISSVLLAVLLFSETSLGIFTGAAYASPIADPRAPIQFRPGVTASSAGVPVVNITRPNAQGLSYNQYSAFDIDLLGLILNNSLQQGGSLLGGTVQANPNLQGQVARTILNEVTSARLSNLLGALEVFGSPANVVIANPNGIVCNGCGMNNIPFLTLTTGRLAFLDQQNNASAFDTAMSLQYQIDGGRVEFHGAGLEATRGRVDVFAEQVKLDAALHGGDQLNLFAGRQTINADAPEITGVVQNGQPAGFAIDATSLGTVSAGRISLIVNGNGAGVRSEASMAATAGDLTISASGDVRLKQAFASDKLKIDAGGAIVGVDATAYKDVTLSAKGEIAYTGKLESGAGMTLNAGSDVRASGTTTALGNLRIHADRDIVLSGQTYTTGTFDANASRDLIVSGALVVERAASLQAGNDLNFAGGTRFMETINATSGRDLFLSGNNTVAGIANIVAGRNLTLSGQSSFGSEANLTAGNDIALGGLINAQGQIGIEAGGQLSLAGAMNAASDLLLTSSRPITFSAALSVAGNAGLTSAGAVELRGDATVQGNFRIQSGADTSILGNVSVGRDLNINAAGNANITGGANVIGNADVQASGNVIVAGRTAVGGDLGLRSGGNTVLGGDVLVGGSASVTSGGAITTIGNIATNANLALNAGNGIAVGGDVAVLGNAAITTTGGLIDLNGGLTAGSILVRSADALNINGSVQSVAAARIEAARQVNVSGVLRAGADAFVQAESLMLGGSILAGNDANLAIRNLAQIAGDVLARRNLDLNSGSLALVGRLATGQSLTATTTAGDLRIDGAVESGQSAMLSAGRDLVALGQISSSGFLALMAGNDLTAQGDLRAGSALTAHAAGNLRADGQVLSGGVTQITAGGSYIQAGQLDSVGALQIQGGSVAINNTIRAGGDASIASNSILNVNSTLDVGGSAILSGRDGITLADAVNVNRDVTLQAQQGAISVNRDLTVGGSLHAGAQGAVVLNGVTTVVGDASITTLGDVTQQGALAVGGNLTASGRDLRFNSAVAANGGAQINASRDLAFANTFSAVGAGTLTAGRDLAVQGATQIGGLAQLISGGSTRLNGALSIGDRLTVNAGSLLDVQGPVNAVRDTSLLSGGVLNVAGPLNTGGNLTVNATGDVTVTGNITAQGAATIATQGAYTAGGELLAGGDLVVNAQTGLTQQGRVAGNGNATLATQTGNLTTQGDVSAAGVLTLTAAAGDINQAGRTLVGGDLAITAAGRVQLTGAVEAGGNAQVTAGNNITLTDTLKTLGNATLQAGGALDLNGAVSTGGNLTAQAATDLTARQAIQTAGTATLTAQNITLDQALLAKQGITATAANRLTIQGPVTTEGDATLTATAGDLTLNQTLQAGANATLNAGGNLAARGLVAGGGLTAQAAGHIENIGSLTAAGAANLTAGGNLTQQGQVGANGGVRLIAQTGSLDVQGAVTTQGNATLTAGTTLTQTGGLTANGDVTLTSGQAMQLDAVQSQGNLAATAGGNLTLAQTTAAGTATISGAGNVAVNGPLGAAGAINATAAQNLTLAADVISNGNVTLRAGNDMQFQNVDSGGSIDITLGASYDRANQLRALGDVRIESTAGSTTLRPGNIISRGLAVFGRDGVEVTYDLDVAGTVTLGSSAGSIQTRSISSVGDLAIAAALNATVNGDLKTNGNLSVAAGTDLLVGKVETLGSATLTAGQNLTAGEARAGFDLALTAAQGTLNLQGAALADGNLSLSGGAGVNAAQGFSALGDVTVASANSGLTFGAKLGAGGNLTLNARGDITLTDTAGALGDVRISSATGAVTVKDLGSDRDVNLSAGGALTVDGVLAAKRDGALNAATINLNGEAQIGRDLTETAAGAIVHAGKTLVLGNQQAQAGGLVQFADDLSVGGNASLTGGAITLDKKLLVAGDAGLVSTAGDVTLKQADAGGNLTVNAVGNIALTGPVAAGRSLSASATGSVAANDRVVTNLDLTLSGATGVSADKGLLAGRDITLAASGGSVTLGADNVTITPSTGGTQIVSQSVGAQRNLTITTGSGFSATGEVNVAGNATANIGGIAQFAGNVNVGQNLNLSANQISLAGTLATGQDATLNSGSALTLGNSFIGGRLNATAAQDVSMTSDLMVNGDVTIQSSGGKVTIDRMLTAGTAAQASNLSITARGDVMVDPAGQIVSAGTTHITSTHANVTNNGIIAATGGATLGAVAGTVSNQGLLYANGPVSVSGRDIILDGQVIVAPTQAGAAGSFTLNATATRNATLSGSVVTVGAATFAGQSTAIQAGATLSAGGNLTVRGTNALVNDGQLASNALLTLQGGNITQGAQGLSFGKNINLSGGYIDLSGTTVADQTLAITAGTGFINRSLAAGANITIDGASVHNGGTLQASNGLSIFTQYGIDNHGTISANDYVSLNTWGTLSNSNVVSGQQVSLWANGALSNSGSVVGGQGLSLNGGSVHNIGVLSAGGTLSASAGTTFNNGGVLDARGQLSLYSGGTFTNDGGGQLAVLQAGSDISLMSGGLVNRGLIVGDQSVALNNTQGTLDNRAGAAADSGVIVSLNGNVNVTASGAGAAIVNAGSIVAGSQNQSGDVLISGADSIVNGDASSRGSISGRNVSLSANTLVLNAHASAIAATGDLTVSSAGNINNLAGSALSAGQRVTLNAANQFSNDGGYIVGPAATVPVQGTVYMPGEIVINAGSVSNLGGGVLIAKDQLDLTTGQLTVTNGDNRLGSLGNASLNLGGASWDPINQSIFALGVLTVTTPSVTIGAGQSWLQPGSVTLQGTTLTNNQGTITIADTLSVTGSVTNNWGVIQTGQNLTVTGDLTNLRSPLTSTYTQTNYDIVLGYDQNGNQVRCDVGSGGSGFCRWVEEFAGAEHGNIAAGGDIAVSGTLRNVASQIVASGGISFGNLVNESQHLRFVWEEYRDHKSAQDTHTPALYLDPPFNTLLNPAANTFFKTPALGIIAANAITGGTFVNEGVIQGGTVTLGAGVNGLTNPAIATVIPQGTGNAGQGAASGAAGASQATGTPTGNTVTILGQNVNLAGTTVTGTTGGGQGGQGAGPLNGSGTTHNLTPRTAGLADTAGNQTVAVNANTGALTVNVGNSAPGAPNVAVGTLSLSGPAVNTTGAAAQTVTVNATPAPSSINVGNTAIATPSVTVTQGVIDGPTLTTTGATGVTVTTSVTAGITVDTPNTSFTGPSVAVNNVNLLAPNATAPPGGGVAGPIVGSPTVTLTGTSVPLTPVNVPGGGGNNPDGDGILPPDTAPVITSTGSPGTAATTGGSEPITNRTNLVDLSVPAGTIIAGTLNLTGDTRNTGFIYAETINIADTVGRLINERRLANPGQHQYELGNGDYVTERGDRLQPGGFISATHWNINAQSILNLSGTFEVKGLSPEDTQRLTAELMNQLRGLYGANFTDQEVIENLIRDVHTNKAPNQLRQIIAIAIAIAITVMTSGADGGYSLSALLGEGALASAGITGVGVTAANAAFTALLTGMSTQLITTGRIDGESLFRNIAIAAVTAGLTQGFTSEFGFTPPTDGSGLTMAQRFTNYVISAGVTGVVQEVAGTGDFRNAFLNSFVSSIAADTARWIGGEFKLDGPNANPLGHALAHAVLGCAAAAAQRTDCASGAIGGATSAVLSNFLPTSYEVNPDTGQLVLARDITNAMTASVATLAGGILTQALGRDGVAGAHAAANEIQNNRLLHPKEIDAIKALAARMAGQDGMTAEQWEARLGAQAIRQVSWLNDGLEDSQARMLLDRAAGMVGALQDADGRFTVRAFYATPGQKLDDTLYSSTLNTHGSFYQRAFDSHTGRLSTVRTPEEDAAWRALGGKLTLGAAAVSGALVGIGLTPTAISAILANPASAVEMGILTTEGAACIATGACAPSTLMITPAARAASAEFNLLLRNSNIIGTNGKPLLDFRSLSNADKSLIGEIFGREAFLAGSPAAQSIGRIPGVGQQGIDEVFKVGDRYVIVEYKFGSSWLDDTRDGLQMSNDWLLGMNTGRNRIVEAVGRSEALNIESALRQGNVDKYVIHVNPFGGVTSARLDSLGKPIPNTHFPLPLPRKK